jgi:CubicO group peptidase (beta-lactamase class C family)
MKKKLMLILSAILLLLVVLQFSFYTPQYVYRVLVWQDADYDDFKKFESIGIAKADVPFRFINGTTDQRNLAQTKFEKQAPIDNLDGFLERTKTNSFLVIRNDTLIYEKYFRGNTKESIQTSFSASKSVLSLLIGVAIQQKKIKSVNDPITDYLPELAARDDRFKKITIAHLLRMRSGLKYSHKMSFPFVNSDDPKTYYHPDLRRVALNHTEIVAEPDEKFSYNNYNALLIGLILERACAQSVSSNFQENMWAKIGAEFNANWSTDENGFEKMESGLNARAIDFAKLGRLVLSNGYWNGEQVIDSTWISYSTQPTKSLVYGDPRKWNYNSFWYSIDNLDQKSDVMAIGNYGQFIFISPENNTIIVRNGEEMDDFDDDDWAEVFYTFLR